MTAVKDLHWRLIASSVLVVTVSTLPAFISAAAIAQAGPAIGYGAQELGILTSIFFLTAATSSARVGNLVERVGWHRTMRFNAASSAVILLVIGAAVRNVWTLGIAMAVSAAIYGAANPAANQALAQHIPADRRGLVFGLKHAGIPTASLLSGLAVPLIVLTVGWPWAFAAGAVIAVAVFFLIPTPTARTASQRTHAPSPAMSQRWLAFLGLATGFATLAAAVLGTFHVDAAIAFGFSEADAGVLLAAASLASIAARATYGHMADKTHAGGLGWVSALTAIGAACFLVLGTTRSWLFSIVTIAAFATGWGWPGLLTYGVIRANSGRPAASTAITQAGIFAGAGAGPVVFGWLIENVSYQAAWSVTGISLLIASALVFVVRRHGMPRFA